MKKFLILEVDSFLIKVKFNFRPSLPYNKINIDKKSKLLSFSIPGFDVYLRNNLREVIEILHEDYTLALWSSSLSKEIVDAIFSFLFPENIFLFVLGKESASLSSNKKFFMVERKKENLLLSPKLNLNRKMTDNNTFLLSPPSFTTFDLSRRNSYDFEDTLLYKIDSL